jgi:hypothetical protein
MYVCVYVCIYVCMYVAHLKGIPVVRLTRTRMQLGELKRTYKRTFEICVLHWGHVLLLLLRRGPGGGIYSVTKLTSLSESLDNSDMVQSRLRSVRRAKRRAEDTHMVSVF